MRIVSWCVMVVIAALCSVSLSRAAQQEDFEVVSVRRSDGPGDAGIMPRPGRYMAVRTTLAELVIDAFETPRYRIVEIEKLGNDRYDVTATYVGKKTGLEIRSMVRRMLGARFGLRTHTEVRRARVHRLVRAKKDGALGSQVRSTKIDCTPSEGSGPSNCGIIIRNGFYKAEGIYWSQGSLLAYLSLILQSPVVDQTGLSGQFDIQLTWQGSGAAAASGDDLGAPPLFAALEDQLGLKLERAEDSVEFLVIDSAGAPSEN